MVAMLFSPVSNCLTKYTVLTAYTLGAGELSAKKVVTIVFLGCCQTVWPVLTMWSMIETHVSLQSSGLNSGTPLDLVLSLVVFITPKLMVKWRGNTEHWSRPLDVCWLSTL